MLQTQTKEFSRESVAENLADRLAVLGETTAQPQEVAPLLPGISSEFLKAWNRDLERVADGIRTHDLRNHNPTF